MVTFTPFEVSVNATARLSPELMKRSFVGSGVYVVSVAFFGFAGACEAPLRVTNAKFTYSSPTCDRHVELFAAPVTGFKERLSMLSAAHHLVGSHALAPTATAQVGHGTHPGG